MLKMRIEEVRPGMVTARAIYDSDGKVLLNAGVGLKESYIIRLKQLGFPALYIDDGVSMGEAVNEVITPELRIKTISTLRSAFTKVENNTRIDAALIKSAANVIIEEIIANRDVLVNVNDIRNYDNYTLGHSVNVCVLAVVTGKSLEYPPQKLRELGVGALLHDIGKMKIPTEILVKSDPLNPEEYELLKGHAAGGFEILRGYEEISALSAHVAYQHHERLNGTGYPRGLKGTEIHEFARLVAICDSFDAMTTDRIYKPGISPSKALQTLESLKNFQFDAELVNAFMENIALYPVGSMVVLSTGEKGIVVDVHRNARNRPIVRLVLDKQGRRLADFVEIDLNKEHALSIVDVAEPKADLWEGREVRHGDPPAQSAG